MIGKLVRGLGMTCLLASTAVGWAQSRPKPAAAADLAGAGQYRNDQTQGGVRIRSSRLMPEIYPIIRNLRRGPGILKTLC